MRARSARNIGSRAIQAEHHLAVGVGAGNVLHQFAADIARVQIGEDQHIGVTGHDAFWHLAAGDFWNQCGVQLQLAFEISANQTLLGLLTGQRRGGLDLGNRGMRRAAFRGERQQTDAGAGAQKFVRQLRGGNRDVSQLIHRGIGNDTAIRHEQDPLLPEAGVLNFEDHATGSGGSLGGDLDNLEKRTQYAPGGFARTGDHAIGLVHRHHHRAEVIRLDHRLAGFLFLDPPAAAQQFKAVGKGVELLALLRIDDADSFQRNMELFSGIFDPRAVSQKDGRAHA